MVTKRQKKELKELSPELRYLKQQLYRVKMKGSFNVPQMLRLGLVKEHTLKKGTMIQGRISGKKTTWILTEKGKRMYNVLNGLGF